MLDIDPAYLSQYFRYRDSLVTLPTGSDVVIVQANANRIALYVSPSSANTFFRPISPASGTLGLQNATLGMILLAKYSDSGGLAGQEWHAFHGGTGSNVYVIEVLFYPPGGE